MYFLISILSILFLFFPGFSQNNLILDNCQTGIITKHNLFTDDAVFRYFPGRKQNYVDGYIAVYQVSDLNKYYKITVNDKSYLVYSADVMAEHDKPAAKDKWGNMWIADLDKSIWHDANLPLMPVAGELCEITNFPTK